MYNMDIPDSVKDYTGKKDSAYMWIIYDEDKEEFVSSLRKKLDSCKNIKDTVIRSNTNDIYFNLINELESNPKISKKLNVIIFSTPTNINIVNLQTTWISVLKDFKCSNIVLKIDNAFDTKWLEHYLQNRDFVYSVSVINNKFQLFRINDTKSVCDMTEESKSMTVEEFIETNISGKKYVLHGSSVKLKNFKETSCTILFEQKQLSHSDVLELYNKQITYKHIQRIEEILGMLKNEKEMDRVVIGKKSNSEKLTNGYLEELYCYRKLYEKLVSNMEKQNVSVGTLIIPIDLDHKDQKTHILQSYDGIIGLTYGWAKSL